MENKNIILLKHHPMNVKFTNPFYVKQVEDKLEDYLIIDVTSRIGRNKEFLKEHPNFDKELSPFFIGPVVTSDGLTSFVFEHFWQCSKVYPCHYKNNKLTPEFFEWRKKWFEKSAVTDKNATRHPNIELGYGAGDCLFSVIYEDGKYKHLNYVEARKKLYYPEYAKQVYQSNAFKWLKSLVSEGKKIALVDFDAYNYYSENSMKARYLSLKKKYPTTTLTEADFTNVKNMKDVINFSPLACGHAFVLKAMLEGDIEVKDGKVIDHIGLFD